MDGLLDDKPIGTSGDVVSFTPDVAGTYVMTASCGTSSKSITVTAVTASISPITRVPMYNAQTKQNDQTVTVTLTPSPLPTGTSVVLELSTILGTGSATFDDDSKSKSITSTTTVKIRGAANSNASGNIKLAARMGTTGLDAKSFTVSTWPVDYCCVTDMAFYGLLPDFTLPTIFLWGSESGNIADLGNVEIQEVVYVSPFANPPFTLAVMNPEIGPIPPIPGRNGRGFDYHTYPIAKVAFNGTTAVMTGSQTYQFRDTVMLTGWRSMADFVITRTVAPAPPPGTYTFTTTKSGDGYVGSITQKP